MIGKTMWKKVLRVVMWILFVFIVVMTVLELVNGGYTTPWRWGGR